MCISETPAPHEQAGFSVVELLLGLALTVSLALAIAPVWSSLQRLGVDEGDRNLVLIQGRVAVARFEKDLRLASAAGCSFPLTGPVLQATPDQVVLLTRSSVTGMPVLVEWEISGAALMRRRGVCPTTAPSSFPHTLYVDHKTMLEGVASGSVFRYYVDGALSTAPIGLDERSAIGAVVLDLEVRGRDRLGDVVLETSALVGR